jgi:Fe-Mn family superoxide dismutase
LSCRTDPPTTPKLNPHQTPTPQEHAYYLQYKNVRPDYVKAVWKLINWKDAEARFAAATSS